MPHLSDRNKVLYSRLEPTFLVSTTLYKLAINKDDMAMLTSNQDWQNHLLSQANLSEFSPRFSELTRDILSQLVTKTSTPENSSDFSSLKRDAVKYPDMPSPEKRPINKTYFENHGSLVCQYIKYSGSETGNLLVDSISVRIFESGALGLRCTMRPSNNKNKHDTDLAVQIIREGRNLARKLLFDAIKEFINYWNRIFPDYELCKLENISEYDLFEKYEFIDFDISIEGLIFNTDTLSKDSNVNYLRQIVGFCRMAKPYAWPNYSIQFLKEFTKNDLSGRSDELWLVYPERLVRYYPNKDIPETNKYAYDILLVAEVLLGLRALYKNLLEDLRYRIVGLPKEFRVRESSSDRKSKIKLRYLYKELAIAAFRFSRCRFPSDIQFYTESSFASRLLRCVEQELNLDELSACLQTELDKLKSTIDSFTSLVMHDQNVFLQKSILWLTVIVGILGALIAIITLIANLYHN